MAKKAETKLSVRLSTQRKLTETAYETGTKEDVTLDSGRAGAVELINPELDASELTKAVASAESCREMRAKRRFETSPGSCCSQVYDSTVKAVTTAENRPAYRSLADVYETCIALECELTKTSRVSMCLFHPAIVLSS